MKKKKLNVTITQIENRNRSANVERPLAGWCCSCSCSCCCELLSTVAGGGAGIYVGVQLYEWVDQMTC